MVNVVGVVRRLTAADAEAVFAVALACDLVELGEPDTELSDIAWGLGVDTAEWFGVDADDGGLSAYALAMKLPVHSHVEIEVRPAPGADESLGRLLLPVAREAAARLAPGVGVHAFVHASDQVRPQWYLDAGGHQVRHFWRMAVDYDDAPPAAPKAAPDVDVVIVGTDEQRRRQVFDVVDAAFRDHFGHDPAHGWSYEDFDRRVRSADGHDPTLWWLATVDGRPAAALIGRGLPQMGFIDSLGTLQEWRGRGLGRMLLRTAFAELHARGYRRITLGVDAANPTGAVALYESVGMRADQEWQVYELPPALP